MRTDIHIDAHLLAELELLCRFSLDTRLAGIKIHHTAPSDVITAAIRLYEKGLITQTDGGYLTDRGLEAAEHIQMAIAVLRAHILNAH